MYCATASSAVHAALGVSQKVPLFKLEAAVRGIHTRLRQCRILPPVWNRVGLVISAPEYENVVPVSVHQDRKSSKGLGLSLQSKPDSS